MNKNVGHFLAFNKEWFEKHQVSLIWLLNNRVTKRWFRWVLRIRKEDIGYNGWIVKLEPHAYTIFLGTQNSKYIYAADLRTHPKFGKRMYYAFRPVWWLIHFWDWLIADRFIPQWSYGFATLTAYPDPNPETTTVDGYAGRYEASGESFATIRAGAGNEFDDTNTNNVAARLYSDTTTDLFEEMTRGIYLFDTASIDDAATISAAVFSLRGTGKANGNGSPALHVVASTPASNTALVNADYGQLGSTDFGSVAYAGYSISAYNDITLNSDGRANISKTGVSKFGTRTSWDLNNSFTGAWVSGADSNFQAYFADETGTTRDPKLVVTYSTSVAYSITAAQGSLAFTGIAALFSVGHRLIAALGSFALDGFAASLTKGKTLAVSVGTFTYTGYNAAITSFRTMIAALGNYALTGQNTLLSVGHTIAASVGSFTYTGINALLAYGKKLIASVGSFTLTGQATTFPIARFLAAASGAITISWQTFRILLNGVATLWHAVTKPSTSWTQSNKPSTTWTPTNKP